MGLEDGVYVSDTVEKILDAMVADAKEYFDKDLTDSDTSVIRTFYRPIAMQFVGLQDDIGLVLRSTQIDNAQGKALDLLVALIGVNREPATYAEGHVTFSRETASTSTNYIVPSGTIVQTEGIDPIRFETTESAVLESGNTETDPVPIQAEEAGSGTNVVAGTIEEMVGSPTGIDSVTNNSGLDGGTEREGDEELRERAKEELSEGSQATSGALLRAVGGLPGVESTKIFISGDPANEGEYDLGNRPGFELVVHGGNQSDIGQKILDTKASGDKTYHGNFGTSVETTPELPNGQLKTEHFSRPTKVPIYIEATLNTTDKFPGKEAVKDSIVNYIGGTMTNANSISGRISVSDDVIAGEVEYAIRDVPGVYDINSLYLDTVTDPNSSENITIADNELARTDALSSQIEIMI